MACFKGIDAGHVDVKTYNAALLAKLNGQWQTNIAKANNGQFDVVECEHGATSFSFKNGLVNLYVKSGLLRRPCIVTHAGGCKALYLAADYEAY
jgi:hypothetical protein